MESYVTKMQNSMGSRSFKRIAIMVAAFFAAGAFILILVRWGPDAHLPLLPTWEETGGLGIIDTGSVHRVDGRVDVCSLERTNDAIKFEEVKAKYAHLRDDKFTIAIQTYKRPDELKKTIDAITSEPVPSLQEIVVIWNDLDENPPADFTAANGAPVRYKMSARNSLNSRLLPDPEYKTQAILLSDDDVYYHPSDLEFVFQSWRKFGRYRLTGALARCSIVNKNDKLWLYDFCSKKDGEDNYAMVLTNLAFSHIAYMDYYSSSSPLMDKVRAYVDEGFNCEDIAMNFVHAHLNREGPLLVTGREPYSNSMPAQGISRKPGHFAARSKCLNDFAEFFSCMPLVNETAHIERGVVPL